jgi:hypothetical protein
MIKDFSRQIVIVAVFVVVLLVLFIAPWLWIDNGENVLERSFFRGNEDEIFKDFDEDCKGTCDGSCYDVKWAPFGVVVDACSKDYYFVSFWGQEFYVDGE